MDKKFFETVRQQASDIQTAQATLTRTIKQQIIAEVEKILDPELFEGDQDVQEFYKDEANTEAWKITDHTETIDYIFEDFDARMEKAIRRAADKVAKNTVEAWGITANNARRQPPTPDDNHGETTMTIEQKLFTAANAIYASAGLTPTPEQEQHNRRDAADWSADILTGKATERDFFDAVKDTILDIFAEHGEATATANA